MIQESSAVIYGTDGRKMSKSYGNVIPLFCPEAQLKKLIMSIKTDSTLPNEPKSTDCALFELYKLFGTKQEIENMSKRYQNGVSWAEAKAELFELVNNYISPMREKYDYYMSHYAEVEKILENGSRKAQEVAKNTIKRARQAIGLE